MPVAEGPAQLTRFQSFAPRQIHRRDITNFEFNPRQITPEARETLTRGLNTDKGGVGLIAPITWNERTGRIVSGHQRASCLDALEGSDNYLLDVAVVQLTEAEEVAANVLMNNSAAQGDWNIDLLAQVLKTPDLNLEATGFTIADLQLNFDDPELASLFTPNAATASLLSDLAELKVDAGEQKRTERARDSSDGSAPGDDDESPASGDSEPRKGNVGEKAKAFRKSGFADKDDTEVMANVIFKDRADRERFMERMGYLSDERYCDGSRIWSRLKD